MIKSVFLEVYNKHYFDETYYTYASKEASNLGCTIATSSTIVKFHHLAPSKYVHSGKIFSILQAHRLVFNWLYHGRLYQKYQQKKRFNLTKAEFWPHIPNTGTPNGCFPKFTSFILPLGTFKHVHNSQTPPCLVLL